MTHVKTLLVDDLWSVIGTTNVDNRSFEHNDEVNVAVRDETVTARLTADFQSDLDAEPRDHVEGLEAPAAVGKARRHGRVDSRTAAVTTINAEPLRSHEPTDSQRVPRTRRCLVQAILVRDGSGPDRDLLLGHRADRLGAAIAVFGALDVVEVLLAREQRAVADVAVEIRAADAQPPHQLVGHPRGDVLALVGIDEPEQDEVAEEHAPVVAEPHQQPRPVERRSRLAQQMEDVGAVEALALLDERLGPDHLFDGRQPDDHARARRPSARARTTDRRHAPRRCPS